MNIKYYFQKAREIALPKDRRHYWFGAVGIRDDGVIVEASNISAMGKNVRAHAEARVARKGAKIIYVCRVSKKNGKFLSARPCYMCRHLMRALGVRIIYYTTNAGYDVLCLRK